MLRLAILAGVVACAFAVSCSTYVSSVSSDGLDTCDDSYNMPYPLAVHFHPTYDSDSGLAAYQLQEAYKEYFGATDCNVAEESTLYSTDDDDNANTCFMSSVGGGGSCSTSSKDDETTFPLCQYGIYVPTEKLFYPSDRDSSYTYTYTKSGTTKTYTFAANLSPWSWMSKYKDSFYESSSSSSKAKLDVFVHASLTCPKLAHADWATFIYPYGSTDAATGITGDYGADGCYGKTCAGCPSTKKNDDDSYTDSSGCCSASLVDATPTGMTKAMATGYINMLKSIDKCSNKNGPDSSCKKTNWDILSSGYGRRRRFAYDSMSGNTPDAILPQWMFSSGCVSDSGSDGCSLFDTIKCPRNSKSRRRTSSTTCPASTTTLNAVPEVGHENENSTEDPNKGLVAALVIFSVAALIGTVAFTIYKFREQGARLRATDFVNPTEEKMEQQPISYQSAHSKF